MSRPSISERTIKPTGPTVGGKLITTSSLENVGEMNYVLKENWRRSFDREVLREGHVKYCPKLSVPAPFTTGEYDTPAPFDAGEKITLITEVVRPNGDRSVIVGTKQVIKRYVFSSNSWQTIGVGFSPNGKRWQARLINGYLVLNNDYDLVQTFRNEDSAVTPHYELREQGVAHVGHIEEVGGFLMMGDITEIQDASLNTVLNGATPYGPVSASLTNRLQWKILWSEYARPRALAVEIAATYAAAGTTLTLAHPTQSLKVGDLVGVKYAGPNGTILGGQPGVDAGVLVTAITGTTMTLGTTSNAALTYPLAVTVMRFADVSSIVGSSELEDDGSAIVCMRNLKGILIVYRETRIYTGRYTGDFKTPFVWRRIYEGVNVPYYEHAIETVAMDYHVYATENAFYKFDGNGEPEYFAPLELCGDLFFEGLTAADRQEVFAVNNPITQEVFFCTPTRVLAFDYAFQTVSTIDLSYSAACFVNKPTGTLVAGEGWMLTALGDETLLLYGATADGWATYQRGGEPYACTLTFGSFHAGSETAEKDMLEYVLQLASGVLATAEIELSMWATHDPASALAPLFTYQFPAPTTRNRVPLLFRAVYFQDSIKVTTTVDADVQLSSRTMRYSFVGSVRINSAPTPR